MKRLIIFNLLLVIAIIGTSSFIYSKRLVHKKNSLGILNVTGAPGENTCSQSSCHNSGSGLTTVSISSTPTFSNNFYVPARHYTIDVTVANDNYSKFGFDMEILTPLNTNAGGMWIPFSGVQIATGSGKKNATHTGPKSGTGSAVFSFVWIAPTSGQVKMYAAGNAVNGNASNSGDQSGTGTLVLDMDTTAGVGIKEASEKILALSVFPNPVISDIKINYSLVADSKVKIALYDLQGKEIEEIYNEDQSKGFHDLKIVRSQKITNGVYMLKVNAGDKTTAQRLIIFQ